jgi:hypothetical protein
MDSKLPLYHWLVVLIPGSIFLAALYFVSRWIGVDAPSIGLGDSETVRAFVFLAAALLVGELLQAIGGLIEPFLFLSWGGSASKRLLAGEKYKREKAVLRAKFGDDLSNEEIFEVAMAYCNQNSLGRSEYFNTLYAYSRSLFVATALVLVSTLSAACSSVNLAMFWYVVLLETLIMIILWHRTKKRGYVFVKEVIIQASLSITNK